MTYKKFLSFYVIITLAIVGVVVGINCYVDIYGLFRGKKERTVYINERTTKYLFSYRYIPENFEGFIMGPSLSANLNPEDVKDFKIYNASIMGANVTELSYLVDNLISKGHMKFAVVCLGPYMTKDHGRKSANIDPKEYYGALGSTNLLRTYLLYYVRKYDLAPNRYAPNIYNTVGWNNFELEMHNLSAKDTILAKYARGEYDSVELDPVAYVELDTVLNKLRRSNIRVIGYYSPVPYQLYQLGKNYYNGYEQRINALFRKEDVLINLNDEKYRGINASYNTFIDHGHLSASGQSFVLNIIDSTLRDIYRK